MEQTVLADDVADRRVGTRFWVFPQAPFIPGYEKPERIWLSIPPDEINDGPSDVRMYVADPLFDKQPYAWTSLPPFDGPRRAPVTAGADRHFDYLDPKSRSFLSAHAYACVHFTLEVWESFLGRPIRWFFDESFPRLEIIPLVEWDNAAAGYGFLELGYSEVEGRRRPYALNFDTIAHEVAHFIIVSQLGVPTAVSPEADFFPYSEAMSDVISLVSFLHFDMALDRLLRRTQGNLLLENELNRFAETSPETQIRRASNFRRMSEVTWEPHDRALPFIGAIFDSIVELYHGELVAAGLASAELLAADLRDIQRDDFDQFRTLTAAAYRARPLVFKSALMAARDAVARALAKSLAHLDANSVRLSEAADAVVSAARGPAIEVLQANFEWREIYGPPR